MTKIANLVIITGMETLRAWRAEQKLSLEEAGNLVGVSSVQWHRYETGARRVSSEKLPAIAKVTGIPAEELRPDLAALFAPSKATPEGEAAR